MAKKYSDRAMTSDGEEREFFFPKHDPPITVAAKSREEAEEKLQEIDNATAS